MRFNSKPKTIATALGLALILVWIGGCSSTPLTPPAPPKAVAPVYAMVDMQKLLDQHPSRAKLREMEQALAAAEAAGTDKTALMDTARQEFESAMKIRQNEDKAAIEKKQNQLSDQLNEERRLYIEALAAEYNPLLFNLDLKLKTVQHSPTDAQALQQEKMRLEAARQQKLKTKEDELAERFRQEMDRYAADVANRSETYAKQWMDERMAQIQKPVVSPELTKQRQAIVELSNRMIADVRAMVTKVAVQEKLEIVWLKPAVRKPVKDITDLVVKELANVIK